MQRNPKLKKISAAIYYHKKQVLDLPFIILFLVFNVIIFTLILTNVRIVMTQQTARFDDIKMAE